MFTGSLTENRVNLCIPPMLRQEIAEDARDLGVKMPEYIRHILLQWSEQRAMRKQRQSARL
jgi:hypothetical protein